MSDTSRSLSAILALFADNSTGNISAQDLRDFVVSIFPGEGSMYVTSSAATTISVATTYYKAAGTTTAITTTNFDMPANNRIRYTGASDIQATVTATISMTCASSNQVVGFKLYKYDDSAGSGAVVDSSIVRRKVGTGSDIGALAISGDVSLSTNDYLELHVTNETSTGSVMVDQMYFAARGRMA